MLLKGLARFEFGVIEGQMFGSGVWPDDALGVAASHIKGLACGHFNDFHD